jgi:hypothetical protein
MIAAEPVIADAVWAVGKYKLTILSSFEVFKGDVGVLF